MIQLLGNGRGQYGSTRNAGLWALAEKAAKIKLMSAAIKTVTIPRLQHDFLSRHSTRR